MKRNEVLSQLIQAKINNQVVQIKIEPTPFETNFYEFIDYSVVQPNLSQIAIFDKEKTIIANFNEITDLRLRLMTPNDLASKVVSMTDKELQENEDDLDLTLETVKENQKNLQEKELQAFIRDNLPPDANNLTVESILLTAWKNTYGNRKIDYTLNINDLNALKETIKIIIKEREELVL